MFLKCLPTGMFGSNCYIAGDDGEAVIIDAGVDANEVNKVLVAAGLKAKYIILTHCHIDHIVSVENLKNLTGASVAIHKDDAPYLLDSRMNGSWLVGYDSRFPEADIILNNEDVLKAGSCCFKIIHTPGHTPGCVCIEAEGLLFTGDTLFKLSKGRTDLGGGDEEKLDASLEKLMLLEDSIKVYPGHGPESTIGYERRFNPYVKE